eukprot:6179214-Pleurochrysis_carterae.AAC.3
MTAWKLQYLCTDGNRRGGARPTTIIRLKVLRRYISGVASLNTFILRFRPLLQSPATKCSERAQRLQSHAK